ncbi:hypothetical protein ACET3Z_028010 [Daucus carota]
MAGAAGTVKKVSLELGGNAPCITFDDAELGVAVKGTLGTKFRNTGQRCICANTILVQEGHSCVQVDHMAPHKPLDSAMFIGLTQFSAMNKLKKMVLRATIYNAV